MASFFSKEKKRRNRGERDYKITYTWRYYDRILWYQLSNDVSIRRRLKDDLERYPEHNIKLDKGKSGVYSSTGGKPNSGNLESYYYTFCVGEVLKRRPRDFSITTGWSGKYPTHKGTGWAASYKLKGLPIKIYKIKSYKGRIRVHY